VREELEREDVLIDSIVPGFRQQRAMRQQRSLYG
jgi:hypothetical protein